MCFKLCPWLLDITQYIELRITFAVSVCIIHVAVQIHFYFQLPINLTSTSIKVENEGNLVKQEQCNTRNT